ncbi:MAG: GNAT family N-acetyltransferase [Myxococcota bacterium]
MSLEIRRFRAAEMEQGWELDRQVFASPPAFKERFLQMADPDRVYGAFDSGRAVALLGVLPFVQNFGGRWLASGGISSVAVAPEFRGQGLASRLLGAALVGMREGGDVVSPLFPANLRLYRQVGWELAGCYAIRKIRARHLLHLERPGAGEMRRARLEDCAAIRAAYQRFAGKVPGMIDGEKRWWLLENQFDRFYTYVAVDAAGEVRGALVYENLEQPRGGEFSIHVHQIFAETRAASLALWWVLGTSSSQSDWVYYPAPVEDPLALLLPEHRQAIHADFRWMLRLVDVPAAIAGRGFPAGVEATVNFALDDPELPENAGAFRLRVEGGAGRLERIDGARLRMGIGAFSSWFSGWGTSASLERAGLIADAGHEGALLDACFAGPTPWMMEEF